MSDEELYLYVKRGDETALGQLYDRHAARVVAIARRFSNDMQVVEEIVQDVFVRVWTTQAYDPGRGRFSHWICTVARHLAIDRARRSKRQAEIPDSGRIGDERRLPPEAEGGPAPAPPWEQRLLREDLLNAMAGLRAEERLVLRLAYFEGRTLSEIAEALNMPLGTVKTRLHNGLRNMRMKMADWRAEVQG